MKNLKEKEISILKNAEEKLVFSNNEYQKKNSMVYKYEPSTEGKTFLDWNEEKRYGELHQRYILAVMGIYYGPFKAIEGSPIGTDEFIIMLEDGKRYILDISTGKTHPVPDPVVNRYDFNQILGRGSRPNS
ncbi:MAG TPA: hypothetical protein PKD96_04600 [Candidatus Absconditabacterales bacterium]|nr:hypothetical protein [Candidatus Absconditabacterales bacterium]HMT27561.1 hypothetical protein [Candidatus Absconditabacterales bacterium]